jgi:hypothetical protein
MPMGENKGGTNCRTCIDCEPMISPDGNCYRCYSEDVVAIKKDFAVGRAQPPKRAPGWCPHRLKKAVEASNRIQKEFESVPTSIDYDNDCAP